MEAERSDIVCVFALNLSRTKFQVDLKQPHSFTYLRFPVEETETIESYIAFRKSIEYSNARVHVDKSCSCFKTLALIAFKYELYAQMNSESKQLF